jgi:hypothetical protein
LLVGQLQPRPDAGRDERIGRKQRGKPPDRVGRDAGIGFPCGQVDQTRGIGNLGQDGNEDAPLYHQCHDIDRARRDEQPQQFVGDTFARQRHQVVGALGAGLQPDRIGDVAEPRDEAEEAQDAQVIFGDARIGIADETNMPGGEVGDAAEIVVDFPRRGVGIERVDREITPRRVLAPVVGERHGRAAPVGRHVAPERRHLIDFVAGHRGDGAVLDPGRYRLDARSSEQRRHAVGGVRRREVDVRGLDPEQRVAHRAPDDPRLAGAERRDQPGESVTVAPVGMRQDRQAAHRSRRDRLTSIAAVAPQIRRSPQRIS